ncbi:MAG TPA: hypothetical protein VN033_07405 [Vulgatibacter sp.]|nr:hypothetical protein [Vulgatibacter sp.]
MTDRQDEILAAIGAIGDRLDGLENRFDDFDSRLRLVEQKLDRVDHRTQDLGSRFTRLDGKVWKIGGVSELGRREGLELFVTAVQPSNSRAP